MLDWVPLDPDPFFSFLLSIIVGICFGFGCFSVMCVWGGIFAEESIFGAHGVCFRIQARGCWVGTWLTLGASLGSWVAHWDAGSGPG